MDEKKQIEEIAKVVEDANEFTIEGITNAFIKCKIVGIKLAAKLYNAGYRKQSEGKWEQFGLRNPKCSLCRSYNIEKSSFCPNCGAKMKGGAE